MIDTLPRKAQYLAGDQGVMPLEQFTVALSIEVFDQALQSLNPKQQQAFLLRSWDGLDTSEAMK